MVPDSYTVFPNKEILIGYRNTIIYTVGSAGYCATKGAITTMTKAMAVDEARHGVRVNEVKPGHICGF